MQIKTGSFTGAGAAVNVECGFTPLFAIVVNMTDNDVLDVFIAGMGAATGIQIGAAVAARSSNGCVAYAGSDSEAEGLTIGSAVAENAKSIFYVIIGE